MRKKDCRSVIQGDFSELIRTQHYAVHHIFPGVGRRRKCEKYGFMIAVIPSTHDLIHAEPNQGLDLWLKRSCQRWYESHVGSRAEFIDEFKRSYL